MSTKTKIMNNAVNNTQRTKVGQGFWQSGYGKGFKKLPFIYLINGKYYAKDNESAKLAFEKSGIEGYIMVNIMKTEYGDSFYEVNRKIEHLNA